jgi:hypothetical protein
MARRSKHTHPDMDRRWLVENRSKIQKLLLDLYEFDNSLLNGQRDIFWPVFGLLIGAAFSLWRAVFLLLPERSPEQMYSDANYNVQVAVTPNII